MKILVLNGPNLNMLGIRQPEIYGYDTLSSINNYIKNKFKDLNIDFYQSNHEGDIIDNLHSACGNYDGIVINAGALTHYSYAIRDAIASINIPTVEVHLSNIHSRDEFRQVSVIAPVCIGQIMGFGKHSYVLGINAIIERCDIND